MRLDWPRGFGRLPLDKLPAVFKYLVEGELGQQLADQLKRPWLDSEPNNTGVAELSPEDQSEVGRKFLRGYQWTVSTCRRLASEDARNHAGNG